MNRPTRTPPPKRVYMSAVNVRREFLNFLITLPSPRRPAPTPPSPRPQPTSPRGRPCPGRARAFAPAALASVVLYREISLWNSSQTLGNILKNSIVIKCLLSYTPLTPLLPPRAPRTLSCLTVALVPHSGHFYIIVEKLRILP